MADDRGERTEQPTGKRLDEARQQGQIPRSGEVGTAMTVLAAAGFLSWMGPAWGNALADVIPTYLRELSAAGAWEAADAEHLLGRVLWTWIALTAPVVATVAVVVTAANVAQVGFVLTGHPLKPNFGKLNLVNGLKRLFGTAALFELAKAPFKLILLGAVAWWTVRPEIGRLVTMAGLDPMAGLRIVSGVGLALLWRLGLAHAAIAAGDYAYQRWSHRRGLRMTKDEVKEEMKQAEGDPQTRARFRSLHRQYAMRRMMAAVPTADVVVTNPTHLAIALRYDAATMKAPTVVAKGARLIAERIRDAARAAGIPIVEHKPLAQALYKAVPVGHEIPGRLYRAVAEVLAYVWALHRRIR
jgi:flagellar biosynthetic protein FlhB